MPQPNIFDDWGCDAIPSVPTAVRDGFAKVPMGGFCFTEGGISIDISEVEAEAMHHPPMGPTSMRGDH